jgi:hypothetical protein
LRELGASAGLAHDFLSALCSFAFPDGHGSGCCLLTPVVLVASSLQAADEIKGNSKICELGNQLAEIF